jgi:hypothetical protein
MWELTLLENLHFKSTAFWDITPYSLFNVNRRFGGIYRLQIQGRISRPRYQRENRWQSCSAYSTLMTEAICSFETSVEFQRTTWRYIPEDSTLHNHLCENPKFHKPVAASQSLHVGNTSRLFAVSVAVLSLCRLKFVWIRISQLSLRTDRETRYSVFLELL